MTPMLGIMASSISGSKAITGNYYSISTATVTSGGTASITFSSIPSTYTHLQLRILSQETAAVADDNLSFQFNGDTGLNYSFHDIYGSGSAAVADGYTSTGNIISRQTGSSATNIFGVGIIDIIDYGNTNKYKTTKGLSGHDNNGTGYIFFTSGSWRNTNAITSITLAPGSGSFAQYSSFALYGVK